MEKGIITIFLCLLLLVPCRNAEGILVDLSEKDIEDAKKVGKERSATIFDYLKQRYRFGKEDVFEENGIIRTKWSRLVMFAGLLSARDKQLTEQDKEMIMTQTDLQINIYTFGNKIDFAKGYKAHLVQKGKIIEPEKISASHTTYYPKMRVVSSGFPEYRATVRSFFPYDKISLNEKAEIVLVKNKKKVVFEVNFADYK